MGWTAGGDGKKKKRALFMSGAKNQRPQGFCIQIVKWGESGGGDRGGGGGGGGRGKHTNPNHTE